MNPGSNLLLDALTVLGTTEVNYFQFSAETPNSAGVDVTTYLASVAVNSGSVQSVDRSRYEALGLDFAKRYIEWYVPLAALDWARDMSGDIIETLGRRFQLVGADDWFGIDGWKEVIGQDIGPATGNLNNY